MYGALQVPYTNMTKYEFYITEIFISNAFAVNQHPCGLFQQRSHR